VDISFLGKVEVDHVLQAMHDGRVRRALARALFDAKVRREYRELRADGLLVWEVVETLAARHHCSEERVVFVAGEAREVLDRLYRERRNESNDLVFPGTGGGKLNGQYVSKRFRHYRRMAMLPKNIRFHSLRHTYASWLVEGGVDLYRVKELMGHSSIQTTMRYAHLAPDNLRNEVERVFG